MIKHKAGEIVSSLNKMLSILDLFSEEKTIWTAEEMANELHVSVPTGYRYVKALSSSGLLARLKGGSYILGPKIIKLDRQVRKSEPMIALGMPVMKNLVDMTGCEVLLSNIYNEEILIIHIEIPNDKVSNISYSRGKPHPLFKSATSKVIIANLPKNQIQKLFATRHEEILESGLYSCLEDFKTVLSTIRRQGYCISHGELDGGFTAIASPVFENKQINGSISLILPTIRLSFFNTKKMIEIIRGSAKRISSLISEPLDQNID